MTKTLTWIAVAIIPFIANAQLPPPVVRIITPSSGPTAGGTTVTVEGENLYAPQVCPSPGFPCFPPRNAISIGFYELRMIETSPTRLVGVTTRRPAGTYDVEIHRADGAHIVLKDAFTFGPAEIKQERVLIPIMMPQEVSGAFGSRWKSELVAYNGGKNVFFFQGTVPSCNDEPCPWILQTHATERVTLTPRFAAGGVLLHMYQMEHPQPEKLDVHFHLRIQDVSRQHQTWGTEIPVVRQKDLIIGFQETQFLAAPFDARFRVTLRIYDFDGENGQHYGGLYGIPMVVEIFSLSPNQPLASTFVELSKNSELPDFPSVPGYAQLDLTASFPQLIGRGPLRVSVRPVSVWLRWWAFLAITNNETQHVTTITPQ